MTEEEYLAEEMLLVDMACKRCREKFQIDYFKWRRERPASNEALRCPYCSEMHGQSDVVMTGEMTAK